MNWIRNTRIEFFIKRLLVIKSSASSLFLVGGTVRDRILDIPADDIDLMISCSTELEVTEYLSKLLERQQIESFRQVGKSFPVFKVKLHKVKDCIDLALARTEKSTGTDHSEFVVLADRITAKEDCKRRDFTINGIFVKFELTDSQLVSTVVDYYGGISDIKNKIIRTIEHPYDRFMEDPLRILRAIRFKNQKGFVIDNKTSDVMKLIINAVIPTVSADRITDEFRKSALADFPSTHYDFHDYGIYAAAYEPLHKMITKNDVLPITETHQIWPQLLIEYMSDDESFRLQKEIIEIMRKLSFKNIREIEAQLKSVCTLFSYTAHKYPLDTLEKCLGTKYSSFSGKMFNHIDKEEDYPRIASIDSKIPRLPTNTLQSWGIAPGKKLGEAICYLRNLQLGGTKSNEEIEVLVKQEFANE